MRYRGHRLRKSLSREEALCGLREAMVRSLRDGDEPFTSQGVAKHFPSTGLLEGRYFNSCAVVSSAGSLKGSKLGNFIGECEFVLPCHGILAIGQPSVCDAKHWPKQALLPCRFS